MSLLPVLLTMTVHFVPYTLMQKECWPIRDGAEACIKNGRIIVPQLGDQRGLYEIEVEINFLSHRDLSRACKAPACAIDGVIQAHRSFNPAMARAIGELVYRDQGWDIEACNEHLLLGHEVLHAAGVTHP